MTVQIWWIILCFVGVLNIAVWSLSTAMLVRRQENLFSATQHRQQHWMVWLSGIYVAGCAFRSFLPRIDLERVCLVQSELSNMMVGRTVATVAELCFIAQGAIFLYQAGNNTGNRLIKTISLTLVPIIFVAECASWYAILSKNYFGHVVENSIWTFSAMLLLVSFVFLWPGSSRKQQHFLTAMIIFAISYIAFMMSIDVPMYWFRWSEGLAMGREYLSLGQGVLDALQPCVVNFNWDIWRMEIPWMTLYFTVAVWFSISLAHVPSWDNKSSRSGGNKK
jgi:hypothetical protein